MVGSNISSTINDSVAYVIRRPKMHQSDLIEAEEPKEVRLGNSNLEGL